ncbi:MAG: hypothetical protein ACYDBT_06680 [Desulfobulbaceae bacterium]
MTTALLISFFPAPHDGAVHKSEMGFLSAGVLSVPEEACPAETVNEEQLLFSLRSWLMVCRIS